MTGQNNTSSIIGLTEEECSKMQDDIEELAQNSALTLGIDIGVINNHGPFMANLTSQVQDDYLKRKEVKEAIQSGLDIEEQDTKGNNLLAQIIRDSRGVDGNISTVKYLLTLGANPNSSNHSGKTPLHYAARGAYKKIVAVLLQDPRTDRYNKDINGKTALDLAKQALTTDRHSKSCQETIGLLVPESHGPLPPRLSFSFKF